MPNDNQQQNGLLSIATALPIIGPVVGAIAQGSQNRKNRRFTRQMYALQREHALADWHMQNQYNSPVQQMARLRDAGLNPNLVYGDGVTGNSSGGVRSSSVNEMNQRAPEWAAVGQQMGNSIAQYQDIKLKEAQINNLEADNTVKAQQAELLATDRLKRILDIDTGKFDLDMKNSLKDYQIQFADLQNRKLLADTQVTLDRNEREIAMTNVSVLKAAEEILSLRLQRLYTQAQTDQVRAQIRETEERIRLLKTDNQIREKDLEWRRRDITPSDPWYWRQLDGFIKEPLEDLKKGLNLGWNLFKFKMGIR